MPKGHPTKKKPTVGKSGQQSKRKPKAAAKKPAEKQAPKKEGRPELYSVPIAQAFLNRVSQGESVIQICLDESMPSKSTVYKWLAEIQEFSDKYFNSKKLSAINDADDIEDIGKKVLTGEYDPAAANVALKAKTWTAARKDPRRYAERQQIEATVTQTTDLSSLDDKELSTVQAILAKAAERLPE